LDLVEERLLTLLHALGRKHNCFIDELSYFLKLFREDIESIENSETLFVGLREQGKLLCNSHIKLSVRQFLQKLTQGFYQLINQEFVFLKLKLVKFKTLPQELDKKERRSLRMDQFPHRVQKNLDMSDG
jgi:DNA repair ATPase RecN